MALYIPYLKNCLAYLYRRAGCICILLFIITSSFAQAVKPVSLADTAGKQLYKTYMDAIAGSSNLFNGAEYTAYYPMTIGSPFWDTARFQTGIISYEGVVYKDIPIAYDLISNEIIIRGYQQLMIKLDASKINFFQVGGHLFVRVSGDEGSANMLPVDMYDLVYNGTVKVYVKRKKQVGRNYNAEGRFPIMTYNAYFIYKDSMYHPVAGRNALLKIFRDKDDAIRSFWNEQKLNYKKDPENTIIQTVNFYDRLKNGHE